MAIAKGNEVDMGIVILVLALLTLSCKADYGKPCEGIPQSQIYCYGDLLRTVQKAKLYPDQKTFVDKPLKKDPEEVLQAFRDLKINGTDLSEFEKQRLSAFIDEYFDRNSNEFDAWVPDDWVEDPPFLQNIENVHLRNWASELHSFWHELGRRINDDVEKNFSRHSMYYVTHPVIVPGGRFKEFYYWDSYWIQRGLLVSGMTTTVRGMIENFLEMVEYLGFIPNGGRVYYQRSQPPLLNAMVDGYYEETKNVTFLENNIHLLVKEYEFFINNRAVNVTKDGKTHRMVHYNVKLTDPRPESFSEDFDLVESMNLTSEEQEIMYSNLKSGAESGWDFSSRWFVVPENLSLIDGNLSHTRTRDIIPVDLNSFMFWNAKLLEKFHNLIGNTSQAEFFKEEAANWNKSIHEVLWDEEAGTWFDYDFKAEKNRKHFYPTNLTPLWVGAVHGDIQDVARKSVNYLTLSGATNFPGGIPTSMLHTGQQWDFPNGWAPLNHLVVEALENSGEPSARALAYSLAEKWIRSNHLAYLQTEAMFEKYDVTYLGSAGGGGEYEVVIGFGWSNGVVLDFLQKYGNKLAPVDNLPPPTTMRNSATPSIIGKTTLVALPSLLSLLIIKYLLNPWT